MITLKDYKSDIVCIICLVNYFLILFKKKMSILLHSGLMTTNKLILNLGQKIFNQSFFWLSKIAKIYIYI